MNAVQLAEDIVSFAKKPSLIGTKTNNGGLTKPSKKDIKQLHQCFKNGKYRK